MRPVDDRVGGARLRHMYPFERFSERAKKVLTLAQREAETAGHSYIGTEHLLLGLLTEGEGLAGMVLASLGMEVEPTRQAIQEALAGGQAEAVSQIIPTSRVKRVIEISFEEARRQRRATVSTEFLLLALLIEGENLAARVLARAGITREKVQAEVERLREEGRTEEPVPSPGGRAGSPAMRPDLQHLLTLVRGQAARKGAPAIGVADLLEQVAGTEAGIEVLGRLLDARRLAALKEEALAARDYEKASQHRAEERRARQAPDEALDRWRAELEPPPAAGTPPA
jgi:Clp amino terminal domain, pathogenicity island component